jgi:hypothetical protein
MGCGGVGCVTLHVTGLFAGWHTQLCAMSAVLDCVWMVA